MELRRARDTSSRVGVALQWSPLVKLPQAKSIIVNLFIDFKSEKIAVFINGPLDGTTGLLGS